MKLYSDYPAQRARQVTADVVAVLLILLWIIPGVIVGQLIAGLGALGQQLQSAGVTLDTSMSDVAAQLSAIPLIGSGVAGPFLGVGETGQALASAGATFQTIITAVSIIAGFLVSLAPIAITVTVWLIPRLQFARRATMVSRMAASADGLTPQDLVALELLRSGVRPRTRMPE